MFWHRQSSSNLNSVAQLRVLIYIARHPKFMNKIRTLFKIPFRFLYWRVCCYVCTREPKKQQRKRMLMKRQQLQQQQQLALQERSAWVTFFQKNLFAFSSQTQWYHLLSQNSRRYSGRSQNQASMRRSMRASQRSTDSGIDPYYERGQDEGGRMGHAYSDMDCRFENLKYIFFCTHILLTTKTDFLTSKCTRLTREYIYNIVCDCQWFCILHWILFELWVVLVFQELMAFCSFFWGRRNKYNQKGELFKFHKIDENSTIKIFFSEFVWNVYEPNVDVEK